MTARRRKWLVAATLLLLAAVAWWFGRGGGKMEVKLVFLGYTNKPMEPNIRVPTRATIMATNCGSVPIQVHAFWRPMPEERQLYSIAYAFPVGFSLPALLRPGETFCFDAVAQSFDGPWGTEIFVERHGLQDRLYQKMHDRYGPGKPGIVDHILSPPPGIWVKLGPITNRPPNTASPDAPGAAP